MDAAELQAGGTPVTSRHSELSDTGKLVCGSSDIVLLSGPSASGFSNIVSSIGCMVNLLIRPAPAAPLGGEGICPELFVADLFAVFGFAFLHPLPDFGDQLGAIDVGVKEEIAAAMVFQP